jgi:hypothetical protein
MGIARNDIGETCSASAFDSKIPQERAAGGAVALPDGRTVTVGRAEFDALVGERRKRAWVVIRKQAPMPSHRRSASHHRPFGVSAVSGSLWLPTLVASLPALAAHFPLMVVWDATINGRGGPRDGALRLACPCTKQ